MKRPVDMLEDERRGLWHICVWSLGCRSAWNLQSETHCGGGFL